MEYQANVTFPSLPGGKHLLLNGSRTISPYETWTRIKPLLRTFGITRVGDITGLDCIGIDVWIAVRPNSRTLSVAQGKGPDPFSARVSAAMEAIETACAERPHLALDYATFNEISRAKVVVDMSALPRIRNSLFGVNRPVYWTEAADLIGGAPIWVPYEMVHADATVPWMPGSGSFLTSTNGLASGNNRAEALLHGICEVVERDAIALWEHSTEDIQERLLLDLTTVDDPCVLELLRKFHAAEIAVLAWDVTSDIGLAAVRVIIFDRQSDALSNPSPAAFGAGCHPNRAVALVRALTEAAQSRLTVISGSRDDFGRSRYLATQSARALEYYKKLFQISNGSRAFSHLPCWIGDTVDDDLEHVIRCLSAAGLGQVLAIDLECTEMPISVVRVIVPGLEGPTESPAYVPGERVRALAHG